MKWSFFQNKKGAVSVCTNGLVTRTFYTLTYYIALKQRIMWTSKPITCAHLIVSSFLGLLYMTMKYFYMYTYILVGPGQFIKISLILRAGHQGHCTIPARRAPCCSISYHPVIQYLTAAGSTPQFLRMYCITMATPTEL